ncbi:MAG: transglycosylase SLT domain-containing protein [Micromonosporaceae bacterium]
MSDMTMVEVAKVAYQAGFRGEDLKIAVAVAWAESGGDPKINSSYPGEDSRGLWQINEVHFGQYDESKLYQPLYNARAAHDIWQDSKNAGNSPWYPWSTWRFGQYRDYLNAAGRAVRRAHLTGGGGGHGGSGGGSGGGHGDRRRGHDIRPWRLPRHGRVVKIDPARLKALAEQMTDCLAVVDSVYHRCRRELDELGRAQVAGERLEDQLRRRLQRAVDDWEGLRRLPYLMTRDIGYVVEVKRRVQHADASGARRTVEGLIGSLADRRGPLTRGRTAELLRQLYRKDQHTGHLHRHVPRPAHPGHGGGDNGGNGGSGGGHGLGGVELGRAWAGTKSILGQFVTPFMERQGLATGSEKRSYDTVDGPGMSDHYIGAKNAYAIDYPTYSGEDEARKLARAMGIEAWQPNSYQHHYLEVDGVRFRVQILWGSGIDHGDHVHVGIRRV